MIVLLFALECEAKPFLKRWKDREWRPELKAWQGILHDTPHFVRVTGVGPEASEEALSHILKTVRPSLVLSAGFAGALSPELCVGDVMVPGEVLSEDGQRYVTFSGDSRARLLTTTRLIADAAEKRRLGEQFQAQAVDMESAFLAKRCREREIPFGCIRAISDTASTDLTPGLARLLEAGRPKLVRVLRLLIGRPRVIGELLRLARDTDFAARRLGEVLRRSAEPELRASWSGRGAGGS